MTRTEFAEAVENTYQVRSLTANEEGFAYFDESGNPMVAWDAGDDSPANFNDLDFA